MKVPATKGKKNLKGGERGCSVCYLGLSDLARGDLKARPDSKPPYSMRKVCYTYCSGCTDARTWTGHAFMHEQCYLAHPDHAGFTRVWKEGVDWEQRCAELEN